MPIPTLYVLLIRLLSFAGVGLAATFLETDTFAYRSLFVGLLFSHFFLGFYYSKGNVRALSQKRNACALAVLVLLAGLYFSTARVTLAPYFLVVHAALSDAYLLPLGTRIKDSETMKLIKTLLYSACFGLLILDFSPAITNVLSAVAVVGLLIVLMGSTKRLQACVFELPLAALVLYAEIQEVTLGVHFLGFYHIMTWYVFSAWMLGVKERDYRKLGSFFGMVAALSLAFILLFDRALGYSVTEASFAKVIGFWSLIHITSTIPLSKFNPRMIKALFYGAPS